MYKTAEEDIRDGVSLSDFLFDRIRPDLMKPAGYESEYYTMVYNAIRRRIDQEN